MAKAMTGEATKEKRDIHWYAFLHENGDANETVALALNTGPDYADRLRSDVVCVDGKKRRFWRITHPEVATVKNAGAKYKFKVTIYVQEGEGEVREWVDPNLVRKRLALMKKVRRAKP